MGGVLAPLRALSVGCCLLVRCDALGLQLLRLSLFLHPQVGLGLMHFRLCLCGVGSVLCRPLSGGRGVFSLLGCLLRVAVLEARALRRPSVAQLGVGLTVKSGGLLLLGDLFREMCFQFLAGTGQRLAGKAHRHVIDATRACRQVSARQLGRPKGEQSNRASDTSSDDRFWPRPKESVVVPGQRLQGPCRRGR